MESFKTIEEIMITSSIGEVGFETMKSIKVGDWMKAIIDRIEEAIAVLLIQPDETHDIYWPIEHLPKGATEGSVIHITMEVDQSETEARREQTMDLINKLKNRGSH